MTDDPFGVLDASFDAAVDGSADLDRFCSSSDWGIPAAQGLMEPGEPILLRGGRAFVALVRRDHDGISIVEPLEAMWGLACGVVGEDGGAAGAEAAELLEEAAPRDWLSLSGLAPVGPRIEALVRAFGRRRRLGLGPSTVRRVASLEGGVDGFLSRRSRGFRAALRRDDRRVRTRGVTFQPAAAGLDGGAALYERFLAIEEQSWKGIEQVGFGVPPLREFYRRMVPRIAAAGRLRAIVAVDAEGGDLGFVFGGIRGTDYRGLQFSFTRGFDGLGNVLQLRMIEALAAEGIRSYDLGYESDYKRRWGEEERSSVQLVAAPRLAPRASPGGRRA